jgi:short subunit fatty acids transporter
MTLRRTIARLRRRRPLLRRLFTVLLALLIVADALPFVVNKEAVHTAAERVPGFWALFGFAGCALIVLIAKGAGKYLLRREDYYRD